MNNWTKLGTHYQTRKDNLFHTKVDVFITRDGDTASAHLKEGLLGRTVDATYFAPAPSDEAILSKLAGGK